MPAFEAVISPDALAGALGDPRLVVIDLCRRERHLEGHIPGALPVDYAALVRAEPPVGGLLPPRERLEALFAGLGVGETSHVVAYDDEGGGRAARLLWTLAALGHERGSLLDGGRAAWCAAGHRLITAESPGPRSCPPALRGSGEDAVADREWILARLGDPGVLLIDVRSAAEFAGADRRAARGGHIPGAVNVDWRVALRSSTDHRLRPFDELRALYEGVGAASERELVVYCQTHQRSSHTFVVLRHLGFERVRGFPGAWSDWGNRDDTPVEHGP